jgi:hypothetical protein
MTLVPSAALAQKLPRAAGPAQAAQPALKVGQVNGTQRAQVNGTQPRPANTHVAMTDTGPRTYQTLGRAVRAAQISPEYGADQVRDNAIREGRTPPNLGPIVRAQATGKRPSEAMVTRANGAIQAVGLWSDGRLSLGHDLRKPFPVSERKAAERGLRIDPSRAPHVTRGGNVSYPTRQPNGQPGADVIQSTSRYSARFAPSKPPSKAESAPSKPR